MSISCLLFLLKAIVCIVIDWLLVYLIKSLIECLKTIYGLIMVVLHSDWCANSDIMCLCLVCSLLSLIGSVGLKKSPSYSADTMIRSKSIFDNPSHFQQSHSARTVISAPYTSSTVRPLVYDGEIQTLGTGRNKSCCLLYLWILQIFFSPSGVYLRKLCLLQDSTVIAHV